MFYLIDKPVGISSFFALWKMKFILQAKKIGHTGTLDPLASGLLIVATEGSTKLIPFLDKARKTYEFCVDFSGESPSCDLWTDVKSFTSLELSHAKKMIFWIDGSQNGSTAIEKILPDFRGKIFQTPPIYSAIRINGKRAYKMARDGIAIETSPREVEIFSLELLSLDFPLARFRAEVSAGTYIRSLGRDIGKRLGLGGIITELRRTHIENWSVKDATLRNNITPETPSIPYEILFPNFGILTIGEEYQKTLLNGITLPLSFYQIIRKASYDAPWLVRLNNKYFFLAYIKDDMVIIKRGKIE